MTFASMSKRLDVYDSVTIYMHQQALEGNEAAT